MTERPSTLVCKIHGELPATSFYVYSKYVICKLCSKNKNHARYLANKSDILAKTSAYAKKNKEKRRFVRLTRKDEINQKVRAKYQTNKIKIIARNRAYVKRNPELVKARKIRYRIANQERLYADKKVYRAVNSERIKFIKRRRSLDIRTRVISHYSEGTMECAHCKINDFRFLCLDHKDGGGNVHRRTSGELRGKAVYFWAMKNNFPDIFRVLCYNCNFLQTLKPTKETSFIRYRLRIKYAVFSHYSGGEPKCAVCDFNDLRALSIDHIGGGGRQQMKDLGLKGGTGFYKWIRNQGYPENFRVLCLNHNCTQLT